MSELPEYLELLPDGNIKVKTKEGDFTLSEPTGEDYDNVERISNKISNVTDFTKAMMLVSKGLIEPKIGEVDLKKKYKLSTLKRLAEGMNLFVDESQNFLLNPASQSKVMNGKE